MENEATTIHVKATKINWKVNTSWFETQNQKVLARDFMKLGSSINAVKAMTSRAELLKIVMPDVLGISVDSAKANWQQDVTEYFNSITVNVPPNGYDLDLSMDFDINDSHPDRKVHIDRLKKDKNIATSEQLKNYVIDANIKDIIPDDFLYRYARMINPEHYIIYIFCLGYKDVANNPNDINKSSGIRFYLFSKEEQERKKKLQASYTMEATKAFTKVLSEVTKRDMYEAILICLFPDRISTAIVTDIATLQSNIMENIVTKAEDIIRIIGDTNTITKALIMKYEHLNIIKKLPPDIYVSPLDPSIVFGNNINEVISYFASEDATKKRIVSELHAAYQFTRKNK